MSNLGYASSINQIINGAPAVDPNVIWRQMGGASYFGDVADATYANMWYTYENSPNIYRELYLDPYLDTWKTGGATTPTATEVLVPQASVNAQTGAVEGTVATRMPATTTPVGNVKAGALAGRIPIGTLIAGTAIGAGVGIKELATHPKFWNDLSDAVFNDLKNPDTYIAKPFAETETADIIWRCLEDGSIQGYCDKRSIDKVVENLYALDAFNVIDKIDTTITEPGQQTITLAAMGNGIAASACEYVQMNVRPDVVAAVYAAGANRYPNANVMSVYARRGYQSSPTLGGEITIRFFNLPSNSVTVQQDSGGFQAVYTRDYFVGAVTGSVEEDGTLGTLAFRDYSSLSDNSFYLGKSAITGGNVINTSNAGAIFTPKNENVIYNGTDVLAPEDINDFWTVFAAWLANGFNVSAYNPLTNAKETTTYIPFTAPENNWQIEDITGSQQNVWQGLYDFISPFTDPTTTPVNNPSPWIFQSIGNFTIPDIKTPNPTPWDNNPKFPQPTPSPIGSSPTILAPTSGVSSGNKLYTVYNPTQAEVDALGGYLWTQNIIELISQFFKNNPLEAIISLHMIYCTPSTGTAKHIILGYLDSNVSAATVTSQYEDVSCGYVNIPEYYGNALDYTGVSVQIYLPFVGFKNLKTKDVMGKRLEVDYKVDVYTGVCLAMLYIISADTRQLLYTFEGNCSVQIPLTAADRTRLLAGITTAGVSAFTGNPAGVVGGIASIGMSIDRSGGFSGNAGAMGVKKPYVIISRAINAQASHYNKLYGYPLNKYGMLSNFRGFTRVQSVHVDIPDATHDELIEIHNQLTEGIVI